MLKAQRTRVQVIYEGTDITRDISPYLLGYRYTDTENISEDITLDLENRDALWMREWFPSRGDKIRTTIQIIDEKSNVQSLSCGLFEIDEVQAKGPPDKISIKALSALISNEAKDTKKYQAWEKVKYKAIAGEIAARNGYEIVFQIQDSNNKEYDKIDQDNESDVEFLLRISDDLNFGVKIEDKKIIISDEEFYENMPASFVIHFEDQESRRRGTQRNKGFGLLSYDLKQSALTSYTACELNYKDPESGNVYSAYVDNDKEQVTSKVLRLNDKVKSDSEAEDVCRKALEKQNKSTNPAKFSLMPRFPISAKTVIEVKDFGVYDGRYLINSVDHSIDAGGGYSVTLDCSKFIVGAGQLTSGGSKSSSKTNVSNMSPGVEKMIAWAEGKLGRKYSTATRMSPNTFDCSSLVSRSMSAAGMAPPGASWSTRTIASSGYVTPVSHSEIRRGDILNIYDDHAMIYLGNGKVIEAQPGKGVVIGDGSPARLSKYKVYRPNGVI